MNDSESFVLAGNSLIVASWMLFVFNIIVTMPVFTISQLLHYWNKHTSIVLSIINDDLLVCNMLDRQTWKSQARWSTSYLSIYSLRRSVKSRDIMRKTQQANVPIIRECIACLRVIYLIVWPRISAAHMWLFGSEAMSKAALREELCSHLWQPSQCAL